MATTILVAPQIDDASTLKSVLARVGFYFRRLPSESVSVVVLAREDLHAGAQEWLRDPSLPDDYDPAVAEMVRGNAKKLRLVAADARPQQLADDAHSILVWDIARFESGPWEGVREKRRQGLTLFHIDLERTRLEASLLAEVAHRSDSGAAAAHRTSCSRLSELIGSLGGVQKAYLVATGPTARDALQHDLSDGVGIVCNTVVLDEQLMDHVKPKVVTFADPIFHFGPSRYAARFRQAVLEQSRRHKFFVVVPERYVRHLGYLLPDLSEHIVGLRFGNPDSYMNMNLQAAAYVRPRPNILTMQMFPLAATLAKELHLIGFDGREPGENYFWKHGTSVQMHDELEGIKRVHPGFFNLDYDDYYEEHVASVETCVRAVEALGTKVVSVTPSHMPPLRARFEGHSRALPALDGPRPVLVTLDPDWTGEFGHYGPLNTLLSRTAAANDWQFLALASRALRSEVDWQVPWFTHPGNNSTAYGAYRLAFENELRMALDQVGEGRTAPAVVALYVASLWQLAAIVSVAAAPRPEVRFVANLMLAHPQITAAAASADPRNTWVGRLLHEALSMAKDLRVSVTVDTEQLADDVEVVAGLRPAVWPMIAVAHPPKAEPSTARTGGPVRVYCPARPQIVKGYGDFALLTKAVSETDDADSFVFIARLPSQPTELTAAVKRAADTLRNVGAILVGKELSEDDYFQQLRDADIIVLPHHTAVFRTRTSAMLIDALSVGRPVVAARGTWLGNYVERFAAGEVFEEGDIDDLLRAVRKVAGDIDGYLERLKSVEPDVQREFSSARLWTFLTYQPQEGPQRDDRTLLDRVAALRAWTAAIHQTLQEGHRAVVTDRVRAAERDVTATLALRGRDVQIERLRAAARSQRRAGQRQQRLLAAQVHRGIQRALRAERRLERTRAQLERSRARVAKLRAKVDRMSQRLATQRARAQGQRARREGSGR